jgi:RNA polymerase sigma-70 factor (ECF subfamily)
VKDAWQQFQDEYEPLRPQLYRYCRHLTRSPWDAEDMVQDALARAFVTLACMAAPPDNPRAWLFRVASNLWINHVRHVRDQPVAELPETSVASDHRPSREAAGTLLSQLSPQERAAVVLKDVFDLSLAEIATALSTTPGAIKTALHRGRGKLVEPSEEAPAVAPAVLDAFCDAFNARDLDRLTSLLLDASTVELPGLVVQYGPAAARDGVLRGTLSGCPDAHHDTPPPMRAELRAHRGEHVMLWWWAGEVDTVVRVGIEGERIARLTSYYHCPDVVAEICGELGVPFRAHGYRIGSAR